MALRGPIANINMAKHIQRELQKAERKKKVNESKKGYLYENYYYHDFKFSNFGKKIEADEVFSYVRYNDGELTCMFGPEGESGSNSDNHRYFTKMKEEMIAAFTNETNWEDSQNGSYYIQLGYWMFEGSKKSTYMPWIKRFLTSPQMKDSTIKFLPRDPIVRSFYKYPDIFRDFVQKLNTKHLVLVGPDYMTKLRILDIKHHIVIPSVNCYLEQDTIKSEIEEYESNYDGPDGPLVFLFSASMCTNTLVDKLHPKFKGKHFMIDCGSIWDNFIPGQNKRGYMKKYKQRWLELYPDLFRKQSIKVI